MKLTNQQYFEAERELKRNYAGLSGETIRIDELARILQFYQKEQALGIAMKALNELSCLGNGNMRGNSQGNEIAYRALGDMQTALSQKERLHCGQFFGDEPCIALGLHFMHQTARGMLWRAFADASYGPPVPESPPTEAAPFRYVYTGPGGIDPQTPQEAETGRREQSVDPNDPENCACHNPSCRNHSLGLGCFALPTAQDDEALENIVRQGVNAITDCSYHEDAVLAIIDLVREYDRQHLPQGWNTEEQVEKAIRNSAIESGWHQDSIQMMLDGVLARLNPPKPTPEERVTKILERAYPDYAHANKLAAEIIAELAKEDSK